MKKLFLLPLSAVLSVVFAANLYSQITSFEELQNVFLHNQDADMNVDTDLYSDYDVMKSGINTAEDGMDFPQNITINLNSHKISFHNYSNMESYHSGGVFHFYYVDDQNISTYTFTGGIIEFSSNSALSGGAINTGIDGKLAVYLKFNTSTITFVDNFSDSNPTYNFSTNNSGGAIYNRDNIDFTDSYVEFRNNYSKETDNPNPNNHVISYGGGAIFNAKTYDTNTSNGLSNFATINFINSKTYFINNYAGDSLYGGGAIVGYNSYTNFDGGSVDFIENKVRTNTIDGGVGGTGGAIAIIDAAVSFSSGIHVTFSTNSAARGGAIYVDSVYNYPPPAPPTILTFSDSFAVFNNNSAAEKGGAIYLLGDRASAVFANSEILFFANKAQNGGAVMLENNASFNISAGTTNFVSNNATVSGGAINSVSSLIDFSDASAEFYNNRSKTGGAIYAQSSTVTFSGGSINFSTNIVSAQENSGGGAIAADLSYINFDSGNIFFLANSSTDTSNSGGALLANDSEIKFENSNVDFTENKAGKNGGAIYAQSSTITFSAGSINFSTNIVSAQENAGGGAIAAELSYIKFDSGNISFSQNSAADASNSGGALLANDSEIKFENSNVDFTENKAGKNGGAVMLENSNFNISAGTTNFINNNAAVSGGAVNAVSSLIDFSGAAAKFYNNMSKTGGAIYAQSSTISFSASAINFSTNIVSAQINAGGGAIAADLSYITFDFGNILFLDNSATEAINSGGALLANDSEINFVNSDVKFTGNKAGKDGGAIANLNSSVYVVGDEGVANEGIVFYRNKALSGNGGAIYNAGLLSIIEEDRAEFQENTASSGGGGAIFNSADGIINFSKSIGIFIENTAANGGAIYNEGEEIKFDSGGASFYQNSAQNGGALFISGSSVNFDATNTEFTENNADVNGGAIYLEDSQLFLNADGAPISFSGNTAGGVSNDIYMKGASNLNISGDSLVRLEGGIKAARSSLNEFGHEIIKTGSGVMELGGINDIESIFDLKEGELRLLQDVSFKIHDATVFAANTKFNMQNGSYDTAEISYLGTSGDIAIEVSADGGYDKIITNKTEITGGNLFIETGIGGYDDQEYYIVVADTGELTGKFDTVQGKQYDTFVLGDLLYDISYVDDTYIKLTLSGYEALRFANINKFTYNQQQVANALHKISMNDPKGHILKTMNYMKNKLSDEQAQAALKQLSAHFLSNFIRNFAADSPNNEIYDKIKKHSSKDGGQSGAWAQMKGGVETFKGNDNSEGDYTNSSIGAMAGYDKYLDAKNILYGVYARFSKDSIEQYSNKADGQKNGLGLYGGYIEDEWEVKAMLLGSYDIFNTKRHIQLIDATAKADISAFTLNWDMEGALKFKVIDNVVFRPYLGFELEDTNYGSVKEKDAPGVNLEIDGGTYLRTAARIGAGAEYTKNIINVYANLEGKYLISGYEPEIQSAFEGTDVEFTSKGTKEGRIALGIGLGGEIQVASAWKVYINGNYYLAENYSNIYGNAGVRYMFGQ